MDSIGAVATAAPPQVAFRPPTPFSSAPSAVATPEVGPPSMTHVVGGRPIKVEFVDITPEVAQGWLERFNTHNRPQRGEKINGYGRDMEGDEWLFNADVIRFSWDEETQTIVLIDGQHRLEAIVKSGVTLTCLVAWGLDPRAQETIDINIVRTMADMLGLRGETNTKSLSAILRKTLKYKVGVVAEGGHGSPTYAEMFAYLGKYPDQVRDAVAVAVEAHTSVPKLLASGVSIGTAYHLCSLVDPVAADQFFRIHLIKGVDVSEFHPARTLRVRFGREFDSKGKKQMDAGEVLAFSVLAFNIWRDGREVQHFKRPSTGWKKGNLPVPR